MKQQDITERISYMYIGVYNDGSNSFLVSVFNAIFLSIPEETYNTIMLKKYNTIMLEQTYNTIA